MRRRRLGRFLHGVLTTSRPFASSSSLRVSSARQAECRRRGKDGEIVGLNERGARLHGTLGGKPSAGA
ncbi:hypothetical protein [Streptomyces sp. NPDC046161]|uniref:hypothetical protein n=1 Tax=Streptomyces sp. NPDC046161 TaxID=3155132 RepID=UPI0033D7C90A